MTWKVLTLYLLRSEFESKNILIENSHECRFPIPNRIINVYSLIFFIIKKHTKRCNSHNWNGLGMHFLQIQIIWPLFCLANFLKTYYDLNPLKYQYSKLIFQTKNVSVFQTPEVFAPKKKKTFSSILYNFSEYSKLFFCNGNL